MSSCQTYLVAIQSKGGKETRHTGGGTEEKGRARTRICRDGKGAQKGQTRAQRSEERSGPEAGTACESGLSRLSSINHSAIIQDEAKSKLLESEQKKLDLQRKLVKSPERVRSEINDKSEEVQEKKEVVQSLEETTRGSRAKLERLQQIEKVGSHQCALTPVPNSTIGLSSCHEAFTNARRGCQG